MFNIKFIKINLRLRARFLRRAGAQKFRNMFILFPDTAVGEEEADAFDRIRIAEKVADAIFTSTGQMNFLISGEWGTGKTSILNLIKKELKQYNIRTIFFSPWKYSGSIEGANAISRAFLTKLAEKFSKPHEVKDLYIKRHIEKERNLITQLITLIPILTRYFLYIVIVFLFISVLLKLVPGFQRLIDALSNILSVKDQFNLLISVSALLALPPLGEYFINRIRERGESEKISSPELLEKKFKTLIDETISVEWLQKLISLWEETLSETILWFLGKPLTRRVFYKGSLSFLKMKRVVVFVDDLDRCDDKEIREFLSGMKTFLEHKQVYYVIAADEEKLRGKTVEEEPEFLRKIVQIDWNVPNLSEEELRLYIKKLLNEAKAPKDLIDVNQTAYLFGINPNPRKVKYYLRRLLFLLNYIGTKNV